MSAINSGLFSSSLIPALSPVNSLATPQLASMAALPAAANQFGMMPGMLQAGSGNSMSGMLMMLLQMLAMMMQSLFAPQHLATNDAPVYAAGPGNAGSAEESEASSGSSGGSATANGQNDFTNFRQGQTGDCAVLSAITSVANDKDGQQILEKSVKQNGDGSYDVTFAGAPGKTYHVTAAEMQDSKLSTGNNKVRALEIAIRQHQTDNGKQFEGSGGHDMIKLLTGKSTVNLKDHASSPAELKQQLLALAAKDGDGLTLEIGATRLNGQNFGGMHGLTVTNIDRNTGTVTYENPWDSSKTMTMSLDQFVSDMTAPGAGGVDYTEV